MGIAVENVDSAIDANKQLYVDLYDDKIQVPQHKKPSCCTLRSKNAKPISNCTRCPPKTLR